MTIARLVCAAVLFVSGLGVGVLWSPLERAHTSDSRALSDVQAKNKEFVAQMREMYGEETAGFVQQYESMSIHIKEYPIDAYASPDGRFIIRLFGSDETIASDLRYPASGTIAEELNRYYGFSCDGRTYSCNLARSMDESKIKGVSFRFVDANGAELTYIDSDADGRWDRFLDESQEPGRTYVRKGLCWEERPKDGAKDADVVP